MLPFLRQSSATAPRPNHPSPPSTSLRRHSQSPQNWPSYSLTPLEPSHTRPNNNYCCSSDSSSTASSNRQLLNGAKVPSTTRLPRNVRPSKGKLSYCSTIIILPINCTQSRPTLSQHRVLPQIPLQAQHRPNLPQKLCPHQESYRLHPNPPKFWPKPMPPRTHRFSTTSPPLPASNRPQTLQEMQLWSCPKNHRTSWGTRRAIVEKVSEHTQYWLCLYRKAPTVRMAPFTNPLTEPHSERRSAWSRKSAAVSLFLLNFALQRIV